MLALVMAMAVMTGCSSGGNNSADETVDPTVKRKEYNYLTGLPFADG